jgi:alpha-1,3-fucosyltransferase 10
MNSAAGPLILFHTSYFGGAPTAGLGVGPDRNFTEDIRRAEEADAVVFHIPDTRRWSEIPRYPGNLWVAWSAESAVNYPALSDPFIMRQFDIRMTYERTADIWTPYFPLLADITSLRDVPLPAKTEKAPAVLFQSGSVDRADRYPFLVEMLRLVAVDSYGKLLNTRSIQGRDSGRQTKLDTIARYKFCLAFENSLARDYVSEKFFDPLLAGTVPVYRGAPNIADFAPGPHSYIDANDFRGPAELAEYLTYLDGNDDAYLAYFAWRKNPDPRFIDTVNSVAEPAGQRLLRRVSELRKQKGRPPRGGRPTYPYSRYERLRWTLSQTLSPA